jgi:hypothetical protein
MFRIALCSFVLRRVAVKIQPQNASIIIFECKIIYIASYVPKWSKSVRPTATSLSSGKPAGYFSVIVPAFRLRTPDHSQSGMSLLIVIWKTHRTRNATEKGRGQKSDSGGICNPNEYVNRTDMMGLSHTHLLLEEFQVCELFLFWVLV